MSYQCSLPVFEGLLSNRDHDRVVQDLLFTLAEWHALAKLRLHTDTTLDTLRSLTKSLGTRLRHFVKHICPEFDTKELPREEAARARRRKRKAATTTATLNTATTSGTKGKVLNLLTPKLHALGDYVPTIPLFGTTDSYSTQPVSDLITAPSHLSNLIELWSRVNLNIAVSRDTTRGPTRTILYDKLPGSKGASVPSRNGKEISKGWLFDGVQNVKGSLAGIPLL